MLVAGAGASPVLPAGIVFVPWMIKRAVEPRAEAAATDLPSPASSSVALICLAIIVGAIYVAAFGPGIHFRA